jgi:PAS domain S-box-containing protein
MRLQLSLSKKVLILVTLPLVVQMGLLARLAFVQREAEADLRKADYARNLSDTINRISSTIYSVVGTYASDESLKNISFNDDTFNGYLSSVREEYRRLKELTADDPVLHPQVTESEEKAEKGFGVLIQMKTSFDRKNEAERDMRKPMWRELRASVRSVLNSSMASAGERARSIAEKSPEVQAAHRQEIMSIILMGGVLNLCLTAIAAVYLTRGLTSRLLQMNDNTYRLASGLPLNPVIQGTDEIARLDQVFHDLEHALKEASRKEEAIFNNTPDLICSLDEQGRVTAANPASQALLAMRSRDLLGTYAVDLAIPEDKIHVLEHLDKSKKQNLNQPMEMQLRRSDGSTVDTLWSVQWSEEEKSFFCIIHDISERRTAEKMKQEVLAMVSHDLRTPLTTTLNALDFLEVIAGDAGNEKESRYVKMAKRNVSRMMSLINDLLDVEKARAGMMSITTSPVALNECFKICDEMVAGYAEDSQVRLDFQYTDLVVAVDDKLFVRILQNLVSNAVKFSPKSGCVKIYAVREGSIAHLTVEDDGPGIPENQLEKVFERFHQIEGQLAKTKGGSGLGLTICKVMTELHGGKIWVESVEGKGSKFQLTVPLASKAIETHPVTISA